MKSLHEQYLARIEMLKSLSPEVFYYVLLYREYVDAGGESISDFQKWRMWQRILTDAWGELTPEEQERLRKARKGLAS